MASPRSLSAPLVVALLAGVAALGPSACRVPGEPIPVLPELVGRIEPAPAEARAMLVLLHRESPNLHARQAVDVAPDGSFRFDPILLPVAGHEFSHEYRAYLHLRGRDGSDRVIWRSELARIESPAPIALDCALDRPMALGEPCRVRDPLQHPWLLAEGKRHYRRLCASCHGADGRGASEPARNGDGAGDSDGAAAPAADLTRIAARQGGSFDRDRVAAWIEGRTLPPAHARGGMPVWGERLSREFERYAEADELVGAMLDPLVAYLESIQRES